MKKFGKRFSVLVLSFIIACTALIGASCSRKKKDNGLLYNEYSTNYDSNVNSWEQIAEGDDDVDITWFTDYSYTVSTSVIDLIYKKTGVRVNFVSAADDKHTELNKWITDNSLPDVVALGDEATISTLSQEGYVYKINKLAESYAPSMLKRLTQDMRDYYKDPDGDMFGLGHSFYTEEDMKEYEAAGGNQYAGYDVVVKKSYLDAYIKEQKRLDANFDENSICKASNFIKMCKWVKETYGIPNNKPTVMMFNIDSTARQDIYNYTLEALMDFFCVPREDGQGNYIYRPATEEFKEVIGFLNDLYTSKLICSANINYTLNQVQSNVQNGTPFAIIGTGQQITNHAKLLEVAGYNSSTQTVPASNQYVSIMLTNEKGDAPLIADYSVKGRYTILISNNCKRVDRVIKMFDYLMSEEGQRDMYYGEEEGVYYNYVVRPGEKYPGTNVTSKYGVIEWTDAAKALIRTNNMANMYTLGICRQTPMTNQIYHKMTSQETAFSGVTTLNYWLEYKIKATYMGYTYSQFPFRYPIDRSDRNTLNDYLDSEADINGVWVEYFAKMVMAKDKNTAMSLYNEALSRVKSYGMDEMVAFRNKCFKAYKSYLGINYAWPKADPTYVAPNVTLYGNYNKYIIDVPDMVDWN